LAYSDGIYLVLTIKFSENNGRGSVLGDLLDLNCSHAGIDLLDLLGETDLQT